MKRLSAHARRAFVISGKNARRANEGTSGGLICRFISRKIYQSILYET